MDHNKTVTGDEEEYDINLSTTAKRNDNFLLEMKEQVETAKRSLSVLKLTCINDYSNDELLNQSQTFERSPKDTRDDCQSEHLANTESITKQIEEVKSIMNTLYKYQMEMKMEK